MTARILGIELRRSGLPIWVLPLLLAVSGLVFAKTLRAMDGGQFEWSTSIFYNMTPLVALTSTLALAIAAWRGGRERRQSMGELIGSTPRSRYRRGLIAWLTVVVWPALAYVPAVVAFGMLSMRAVSGPALFGVLAAALSTVVAYAALGFVIGWYVPGRFTAPVAGVVVFIGTVALGSWAPAGLLSVVPQPTYGTIASNRLSVGLWDRPLWWFAPVAMLWFVSLAAALLLVALARRRWITVVPLVVAALAVVPLVGTKVWRIDTTSPLLACSDGAVRVCVPKATEAELDRVTVSTRPVRTRLAGLPTVAPQGEALPKPARAYVWPQQCRVLLDQVSCDSSREVRPSDAGRLLAERTAGWKCSDSAPPTTPIYTSPAPKLEKGVQAWLLGSVGNTAPQVAQRIAALPDDEQREWLSRYLMAASSCDRSVVEGLRSF